MMTRTQKATILEMRAEGITYKTIAEQMGMSLGSVKMFVSRHHRADDRRCEQCGKLLPNGAAASQRFCTIKCKTVWWNANPTRVAKQVHHTCAICGISFMGGKAVFIIFCKRANCDAQMIPEA